MSASIFQPLEPLLDMHFDKHFNQLPGALRPQATAYFQIFLWDALSPEQRREHVKNKDSAHDPATQAEQRDSFALTVRQDALEIELRQWELTGVPTASDLQIRDENIKRLNAELAEVELLFSTASMGIKNASPAPVVAGNAPALQVNAMKKAALIAELEYEWSSIEADISDATRNGLKAAAHTGKHGEWDKGKARAWAVSKGKIKQTAPVHSLAGAWPGTTTRHTISH